MLTRWAGRPSMLPLLTEKTELGFDFDRLRPNGSR